jgi:hypothetical protein
MTFKVVIAYLSYQETDQLASWARILLQILRSSHKTQMICITQKISAAENHQENSASNEIIEETSHPASSIDIAEQQASYSVSTNKIDGHMFDDVKETDIAIEKSVSTISDKPSRCVVKWVDADSAPFICSALNPLVQNNRQNKIRYTFEISNCDEIFDILVLEKRIRIHVDRVISSSKELENCAYYK